MLNVEKTPVMVGILVNAWRRYKNRTAAQKELAAAYEAVSTKCQNHSPQAQERQS